MSKHTPGPWTAEAAHRLGYVVYANIEPFVIVESADDEGRYGPIASEANARLIASAPDLLAALEKCEVLALSNEDPEDLLEEVRIAAHAAIALAKGKA